MQADLSCGAARHLAASEAPALLPQGQRQWRPCGDHERPLLVAAGPPGRPAGQSASLSRKLQSCLASSLQASQSLGISILHHPCTRSCSLPASGWQRPGVDLHFAPRPSQQPRDHYRLPFNSCFVGCGPSRSVLQGGAPIAGILSLTTTCYFLTPGLSRLHASAALFVVTLFRLYGRTGEDPRCISGPGHATHQAAVEGQGQGSLPFTSRGPGTRRKRRRAGPPASSLASVQDRAQRGCIGTQPAPNGFGLALAFQTCPTLLSPTLSQPAPSAGAGPAPTGRSHHKPQLPHRTPQSLCDGFQSPEN